MDDPRSARRAALFVSAGLVLALACTCSNPLVTLRGGGATEGGIGDYVWVDANGNGIQNDEEQGMPGVEVQLFDDAGSQVAKTTTDAEGAYHFSGQDTGTYSLVFVHPDGMGFTLQDQGLDDALDSDPSQATGRTEPFDFDGSEDLIRDAGLVAGAAGQTPQPPKATPTPKSTATAEPSLEPAVTEESSGPQVELTYHHTVPGQYSEIIILFSNLAPRQQISGQVLGPAVDGNGKFTAFGAADGTCEIRVKIFAFGTYDVDIPELGPSQTINVTAQEPPGN